MKLGAFLALACLAVAGWAVAGCAPAAAPGGRSHGPKIVSLNPCSDAVLAEVADPAQILAISHYSHDPRASSMPLDQARRFRSTGGTVEEVIALKPDVVVYNPMWIDVDELVRILESGANVVATASF